jgi:DNA repair exonuclease SbcCD ATPase subunit
MMPSTATSKRGVPLHILNSRMPMINAEIAKILGDSTNFTIDLEAPVDSNEMNIYIDYGDSRRPIECASGMEKMLSSLAIRVALINVSMLPKSDILIIDEGFGALDESNVEACSRLLQSLKNYFKSIFIISHVEAVKDGVDNLIEIVKDGADSYVRSI